MRVNSVVMCVRACERVRACVCVCVCAGWRGGTNLKKGYAHLKQSNVILHHAQSHKKMKIAMHLKLNVFWPDATPRHATPHEAAPHRAAPRHAYLGQALAAHSGDPIRTSIFFTAGTRLVDSTSPP